MLKAMSVAISGYSEPGAATASDDKQHYSSNPGAMHCSTHSFVDCIPHIQLNLGQLFATSSLQHFEMSFGASKAAFGTCKAASAVQAAYVMLRFALSGPKQLDTAGQVQEDQTLQQ
jgi:hypothetical protein